MKAKSECRFEAKPYSLGKLRSEAWGEKWAPALPKTGNCFALLACMHARTHAHTELTGRATQKTPRLSVCLSVPPFPHFLVFSQCFWICMSTRTVFLTNVSRISLSWGIWKAWDAICSCFHEEIECLCCSFQLNCDFARVFSVFSSWLLS